MPYTVFWCGPALTQGPAWTHDYRNGWQGSWSGGKEDGWNYETKAGELPQALVAVSDGALRIFVNSL